jgi:hypothetical protein
MVLPEAISMCCIGVCGHTGNSRSWPLVKVSGTGQVIYQSEKQACRAFPDPKGDRLHTGVPQNFQIVEPRDFLAEFYPQTENRSYRRRLIRCPLIDVQATAADAVG